MLKRARGASDNGMLYRSHFHLYTQILLCRGAAKARYFSWERLGLCMPLVDEDVVDIDRGNADYSGG